MRPYKLFAVATLALLACSAPSDAQNAAQNTSQSGDFQLAQAPPVERRVPSSRVEA